MPSAIYATKGATSPVALPTSLASLIGQIPASLNMAFGFYNDGKTQYGQHTDFTNTSWNNVNNHLTIVQSLASFDGTKNCQKLIPDTANTVHQMVADGLFVPGTPHVYRVMAIAKADGYSRIVLQINNGNAGSSAASFGFDLSGGNTNYDGVIQAHCHVVNGPTMTQIGSTGFWICQFDWGLISGAFGGGFGGGQTSLSLNFWVDNGVGTAARSTVFAGDGVKGVDVLLLHVLPVVMWSWNGTPVFNEEFNNLNSIDLNNTGDPSKTWFTNFTFPNTPYTSAGFAPGGNVGITPSSVLTIPANSVLQIYEPSGIPNFLDTHIATVRDNGAGGLTGLSNTWTGSQIHDCLETHSQGLSYDFIYPTSPSCAYWSFAPDALVQNRLNPRGGSHTIPANEWDFFEIGSPSNSYFATSGASHWGGWFNNFASSDPTGAAANFWTRRYLGDWKRRTAVWISSYEDPYAIGYGMVMGFVDGQGSGMGGYARGNTGGGNLLAACIEWQSNQIVFNATNLGPSLRNPYWPWIPPGGPIFQIDWVRVYQPSSPVTMYVFYNQLDKGADVTTDDTALIIGNSVGTNFEMICANLGKQSGKWYWEHTLSGAGIGSVNDVILGIADKNASVGTPSYPGSSAKGAGLQYNTAANTNINGVTGDYAGTVIWVAGDVIGFALDLGAGKCWIHKNGTWINGAPGSGTDVWSGITSGVGLPWYPAVAVKSTTATVTTNFGQTAFAFTLPAGYSGWTHLP